MWSMYDTVESTVQFCLQKPNVHNSTLLKNTYEVSLIQGGCIYLTVYCILFIVHYYNIQYCLQNKNKAISPRHPICAHAADLYLEQGKLVAVVAPYDEVTEDEGKKPTRRAPPVPVNKVHFQT